MKEKLRKYFDDRMITKLCAKCRQKENPAGGIGW